MLRVEDAAIVLSGDSFNVGIFQQSWLLDTNILTKEEFAGENFFTPVAVNVSSGAWTFLVVPQRIQLVYRGEKIAELAPDIITRIIGGISKELPHTPVRALGLNFSISVSASDPARYREHAKRLFVCPDNPLGGYFNSEDARFGAYFSKTLDSYDARIKLDIKPINDGQTEFLRLNFNVHKDIASMKGVSPMLEAWPAIYREVVVIADSLSGQLDEAPK